MNKFVIKRLSPETDSDCLIIKKNKNYIYYYESKKYPNLYHLNGKSILAFINLIILLPRFKSFHEII